MISTLIREFLIPLLIFWFLRVVLRNLFAGFGRSASRRPPPTTQETQPTASSGGVLHKDPVCGTYVSADTGIALTVKGRVVYFCSPGCRDRYRAGDVEPV
jgi:YHS domain-containing protein